MKVSVAVRMVIAAAGAAVIVPLSSSFAHAQEGGEEKLEQVVVTGSRIVSSELESVAPLTVVSAEDIARTGLNNLGDVLFNLSSSDGTALRPITTATNGSDGSSQISLRNLGSGRTLVLVDGRRWITGGSGVVDLNTIPTAMIERVEVLKDGASAIYGSDAIAGVINVILRKNFDGIQLNANVGITDQGDGRQDSYSLTIGASSDKSSGVIGLAYAAQEPIFARDRTIAQTPLYGCTDPADPTKLTAAYACGSASNAYGRFVVGGSSRALIPGQAGTSPSHFRGFTNADRYNYAPVNYIQQPVARYNLFSAGSTQLSDNVEAYAKLAYTKIQAAQQLAEVPATPSVAGANGPQWTIGIPSTNVFNPFGAQINSWGFRFVAVGPRNPTYDYDTYGVNLGMKGDFEFADKTLSWDVGVQSNVGRYDSVGNNYINLFNLRNAVGPSFRDSQGTLRCGTPTAIIPGCVPFNVFGGPDLGVAKGVITAAEARAMVNYVGYTQVSTAGLDSTNWYADVSTELFDLPAGPVAVAVGFEYRKNDYFDQPDTLVASGGSSDNFSEPTKGGTAVKEYFIEAAIPIVKDLPFINELNLSFANRWSDYSGSGRVGLTSVDVSPGKPSTYKAGLTWRPIEEVLVRATIGETFRAPSVTDLFAGKGEGFPVSSDPCNTSSFGSLNAAQKARCQAAGVPVGGAVQLNSQLRQLGGGNPNLQPEEGENWTAGIVWDASVVPGLSITLDYWSVELDNAISGFGAGTILSRCHRLLQEEYCGFIERITADGSGSVAAVNATSFNAAQRQAAGWDLGVRYALETERFGRFSWQWDTTKVTKDRSKLFDSTDFTDYVGYYTGGVSWEVRSNLSTNWQYGDFSVNWTMRYMSEQLSECFWFNNFGETDKDGNAWTCNNPDGAALEFFGWDPASDKGFNRFGSHIYHDLQASWKTPWKGVVTIGGRNITGKEPVVTDGSFAHSFEGAYDLPGGPYWYAAYSQKF